MHTYKKGSSQNQGFLEDYSYMILALIDLYQTDFDPQWFLWAKKLQKYQDDNFWDKKHGGYAQYVIMNMRIEKKILKFVILIL